MNIPTEWVLMLSAVLFAIGVVALQLACIGWKPGPRCATDAATAR